MSPTLQSGDVVLVNTWAYHADSPQVQDIVLIRRSAQNMVLVKRVTNTRLNQGKVELFIEGDNPGRSVDSRRFGWLSGEFLMGRVAFVWFSFGADGRYLHALP